MEKLSIISGIFACLFGIYFFNAYSKGPEGAERSKGIIPYAFYLPAALFFTLPRA